MLHLTGQNKYIVYKAIHRSLVLAEEFVPIFLSKTEPDDCFFRITLLTGADDLTTLDIRARSEYVIAIFIVLC
jgi:hypothetical protein